jgi:hypothetical protein
MKQYTKIIDGKTVRRTKGQIVIVKDGMQTINPSEEMILADGWEVYTPPTPEPPTEEQLLERAKTVMKANIMDYDSSEEVNQFMIGEIPMWLDKVTRTGLMLRFQAEQASGKTETTLWHEGNSFVLNLEKAMQLLYGLEVYASACYDNTQIHLTNVDNLLTIEDINNYDYTSGYPDKLYFNS